MADSESTAMTIEAAPVDVDIYDPEIDDALPPFRPGGEPAGQTAGAWLKRWGVGLAGWAVFVAAMYLTAGHHLNGYLSVAGLMIGFLVGLTGMGGGALMTPVLVFVFGFQPTMAIGTDITYAAVTKIAGSYKHWRQGSVDIPLALWLALGSIPASLLGVVHHRLREEPLRGRADQRDPLQGDRLGADDRRRAAHREGRHARRRSAPPREHQDDAQDEGGDRRPRASARGSSSASPRSAAVRCSPSSSSCCIRSPPTGSSAPTSSTP